jgi:hypothetical protein
MSPIEYAFTFNDRRVLENICKERGYVYLHILSPEMQNAKCIYIYATLLESIYIMIQLSSKYKFIFTLHYWR